MTSAVVRRTAVAALAVLPIAVVSNPAAGDGCPVWQAPAEDALDPQLDIVEAAMFTAPNGDVGARIQVVDLQPEASGTGDEFRLEFEIDGKPLTMYANRGLGGIDVDEQPAGFTGPNLQSGTGTAVFDDGSETVTITGPVSELSKALGEEAGGRRAEKLIAVTAVYVPGSGVGSAPADVAETDATFVIGTACTAPTADGSTSPDPSASNPDPSRSAAPPCTVRPHLEVLDPLVTVGEPVRVRYHGTPGAAVTVDGYGRTAGTEPTYRELRRDRVGDDGTVLFTFRPPTNTRLRARDDGCPESVPSAVLRVRLALTLTASRHGPRDYVFSGRLTPGPHNNGRFVSVAYRSGDQWIQKATTHARDGRWTVRVSFQRPGRWTFIARSGDDMVNVGNVSPARPTSIH